MSREDVIICHPGVDALFRVWDTVSSLEKAKRRRDMTGEIRPPLRKLSAYIIRVEDSLVLFYKIGGNIYHNTSVLVLMDKWLSESADP